MFMNLKQNETYNIYKRIILYLHLERNDNIIEGKNYTPFSEFD